MFARAVLGLLALTLCASATSPQGTGLALVFEGGGNTPAGLVIVRTGQEPKRIADGTFRPVGWSLDGRWILATDQNRSLTLFDPVQTSNPPVTIAQDVTSAEWSSDGASVVYGAGKSGVFLYKLSSAKSDRLIPVGTAPTFSPDARRIAFVGTGSDEGVWVMNSDGSDTHRVVRSIAARSVQYRPDGRTLAIVAENKGQLELLTVGSDGRNVRKLGAVGTPSIKWSPSGTLLLSQDKDTYTVIDASTGTRTKVEGDYTIRPQWIGPRRLMVARGGKLFEISYRGNVPTSTELGDAEAISRTTGKLVALLQGTGLIIGESETSPFRGVSRPTVGQLRLEGTVVDLDPIDGKVTLSVRAVTFPNGSEMNFGDPKKQIVQTNDRTMRDLLAAGSESLSSRDLRGDSEVSALVSGRALSTASLSALSFRIAGNLGASGDAVPEPNRPSRPRRSTEYDGVSMDRVVVPMTLPVYGRVSFIDSFLYPRGGGTRRHHGQDLMAPKMTPLLACFDGTVSFGRTRASGVHNTLYLDGDNGYYAAYMHINNDTPGTDDGEGSWRFAFAPGLQPGDRVVAGQFLGWVGDSGNAESTGPHLHFELHDGVGGGVLNAYPSLKQAKRVAPVYRPLPFGDKLRPGEVRWEAVVANTDPKRNYIVGDLIATQAYGKAGRVAVKAERVYLPVGSTAIGFHEMEDLKLRLSDMKQGLRVVAIGKASAAGKPTTLRFISVDLP